MKKLILFVAVVAIAAVAAFNVNLNLGKNKDLSSIALANIEALAQVEDFDVSCSRNALAEIDNHCYVFEEKTDPNEVPCRYTGSMHDICKYSYPK